MQVKKEKNNNADSQLYSTWVYWSNKFMSSLKKFVSKKNSLE